MGRVAILFIVLLFWHYYASFFFILHYFLNDQYFSYWLVLVCSASTFAYRLQIVLVKEIEAYGKYVPFNLEKPWQQILGLLKCTGKSSKFLKKKTVKIEVIITKTLKWLHHRMHFIACHLFYLWCSPLISFVLIRTTIHDSIVINLITAMSNIIIMNHQYWKKDIKASVNHIG